MDNDLQTYVAKVIGTIVQLSVLNAPEIEQLIWYYGFKRCMNDFTQLS